jgi:type II secretory pathway pseudopilin PulG
MKRIIKTENGFTLIEILLIVGFIGVASSGIYTTYKKSSIAAQVDQEAKNIRTIQDGILGIYANDRTFQNLDNTLVNNSNVAPNSMRDGTAAGIRHIFGSNVIISTKATNRANDTMVITYNNIPSDYCSKLVTEVKDKFDQVLVNNTSVRDNGIDNTNVGLLPALCNANANSTLAFANINYSTLGGSGVVDPIINSVKPINSTPLATETTFSNPNYNSASKGRYWGKSTNSPLSDSTVPVSANARVLGLGYDGTVTFNASQKNIDVIYSALDPWYKAQLAANGGNVPASFSDPMFGNDPTYAMQVVAMITLADVSGTARGSSLPGSYLGLITNFKTYVGAPLSP